MPVWQCWGGGVEVSVWMVSVQGLHVLLRVQHA